MARFLFASSLVLFITILKSSAGEDTLYPNQTIVDRQTLISQSQIFELGFFSPGSSSNRFVGVWYKSTPDVVVWVANRNDPITDSEEVFLAVEGNRTLVIRRAGTIIWSANSSGVVASDPVLQLLDTGNLVLIDKAIEDSFYIWQSFDYPTDTWLPEMKIVHDADAGKETYLRSWRNWNDPSPGDFVFRIDNHGLPEMVVSRGTRKMFRIGKWNGFYFDGVIPFPNSVFRPQLAFKEEKLTSIVEPTKARLS